MIRNILHQQNEERNNLLSKDYVKRTDVPLKAEYLTTGLIKLITGPRRAGKSVWSLQLLKDERFAYLNFDDDLLLKNFDENDVVQSLNEIYPDFKYLLLDEIQNLPDWELWVNKLHRRGINLIITGSNAKLLSGEMATSLTGRFVLIEIYPFSFTEMLSFYDLEIPAQLAITPAEEGNILSHLSSYQIKGGFPEIVLNQAIAKNYLSALFDSVLLKDIVKRYRIRQAQQLYDLSNYLLSNYAKLHSFSNLKKELNFNSVATIQKFARYLSESYLFVVLPKYSVKIKTQQKSPDKFYVIDNGFIKARSFEISPNHGRLLENVVFVELLRRQFKPGLDLFYYHTRNKREVDFICRRGHKVETIIQVCYDITDKNTLKREISAFNEASEELTCNNLLMITWDKEGVIEYRKSNIRLVKAWKWLCGIESVTGNLDGPTDY